MIDIYSLPNCSKCRATKTAMVGRGLVEGKDWVEHDLSLPEYESARQWALEDLRCQEAPIVVVTEQNYWSGFRPDKIIRLKPEG